jgi:hypothetical protein
MKETEPFWKRRAVLPCDAVHTHVTYSGCACAVCRKISCGIVCSLIHKICNFQKGEHTYFYSIWLCQWSNLLFWNFSIFCLLTQRGLSETASASVFRQGQHLIWWASRIQIFWVTGHSRTASLLRYVPENRSCPSVVQGRWLSTIKN